jgi:hypothetical protein
MGVDVEMRLAEKGYVPQDKIDRFRARFPDPSPRDSDEHRYPDLLHNGSVRTMERLFSRGYARGHWPDIKAMILWLRAEFGQDVRYGGDSGYWADTDDQTEWPPIITDEDIGDLDAFWEAIPKDEGGYRAVSHHEIPA